MENREFEEVYRRWYRPLLLYAFSLTRERSAAEDLTQSAFMKALLSYHGERGSLHAWLIRVLHNEFVSQWRKDRRLSGEDPSEAPGGGDPLETVLQSERQRRVYEAVLSLPEHYRDVLLQSAVMGMSDGEIAALRKTSEENVRQLRCRARAKVRKIMEEGDA